ncbi:MAG: hypothetical protein E6R03_11225 [Hyphomicrobiaceae bacterium]|nr:MAG: hypothetical protein E6R03_11225 [Hyphomicrobiaceae bacterium]
MKAMTPSLLRKWMTENDKTAVDIASATKVHPQTVQRYLDGKSVRRIIVDALTRLVSDEKNQNKTAAS